MEYANETSQICLRSKVSYCDYGLSLWHLQIMSYLPLINLKCSLWPVVPFLHGICEWNFTDMFTIKGFILWLWTVTLTFPDHKLSAIDRYEICFLTCCLFTIWNILMVHHCPQTMLYVRLPVHWFIFCMLLETCCISFSVIDMWNGRRRGEVWGGGGAMYFLQILFVLEKSPRKRGNISWLSIYLYFAFKKAETCIPLSCVLIFHSFMKSETCIGDSSRWNDHGPK